MWRPPLLARRRCKSRGFACWSPYAEMSLAVTVDLLGVFMIL